MKYLAIISLLILFSCVAGGYSLKASSPIVDDDKVQLSVDLNAWGANSIKEFDSVTLIYWSKTLPQPQSINKAVSIQKNCRGSSSFNISPSPSLYYYFKVHTSWGKSYIIDNEGLPFTYHEK